jgi:glycosyltransferase 2 family protein
VTWFIVDRMGLTLHELQGVDLAAWVPAAWMLAASAALLALGYFVSASLWGRIVSDLGGPRLPTTEAVRIFMIANLGRYLPGKLWQIAGLAALARRRGVPASTATAAAVLGQGLAIVAALLVGLGALLGGGPTYRAWGEGLSVALLVGVALGATRPVFQRVSGLWFRLARQEVPPALGGAHVLRWLLLYVANWALYALSFWVLTTSFHLGVPLVPAASAFAAAYALGYVAIFAVAGLGVREGFLVVFLTPWMGAGPAGVLAVVARIWTTVVELVPAVAFWLRHVTTRREGPDRERRMEGRRA